MSSISTQQWRGVDEKQGFPRPIKWWPNTLTQNCQKCRWCKRHRSDRPRHRMSRYEQDVVSVEKVRQEKIRSFLQKWPKRPVTFLMYYMEKAREARERLPTVHKAHTFRRTRLAEEFENLPPRKNLCIRKCGAIGGLPRPADDFLNSNQYGIRAQADRQGAIRIKFGRANPSSRNGLDYAPKSCKSPTPLNLSPSTKFTEKCCCEQWAAHVAQNAGLR